MKKNNNPFSARRAWLIWAGGLLGLWWLLVEGRTEGIWFVLPVLALAYAVRRAMPIARSTKKFDVVAFVSFIPYFIWHSLVGGIDVAWRSFHPKLPLDPAIYSYPFRIRSEGGRVFLAQVVSLMPGTLACRIGERNLIVHVLSGSRPSFVVAMTDLETRTARIFRETEATHA